MNYFHPEWAISAHYGLFLSVYPKVRVAVKLDTVTVAVLKRYCVPATSSQYFNTDTSESGPMMNSKSPGRLMSCPVNALFVILSMNAMKLLFCGEPFTITV